MEMLVSPGAGKRTGTTRMTTGKISINEAAKTN